MKSTDVAHIVVPIGPGKNEALDTLESIEIFCKEPHNVIIIDDSTQDGTYDALLMSKKSNWIILRNSTPNGTRRLVQSLCYAYQFILSNLECKCILRLDQDALIIGPNILSDAIEFSSRNRDIGIFGVYSHDYNRPRSYRSHSKLIIREAMFLRSLIGISPSWRGLLRRATMNGYKIGDNVFGGAYFITYDCLSQIEKIKGLAVPYKWHSRLQEDVYFSMAAVAAGFRMGHFAAPEGPMCLEWRGLPHPALQMWRLGYKIVHSVDKGQNVGPEDNNGRTARDVFRELRNNPEAFKDGGS